MRRTAVALALAWAGTLWAEARRPPTTVCVVVRDVERLDGRIVVVRGILQDTDASSSEPYFDELVGEDCTGSDGERPRVKVVSPDWHFLAKPPTGYRPDIASIRRADRFIAKLSRQGRPPRKIWATVEGVIYFLKPESATGSSTGAKPSHKRYVAYIVVQAIRDLSEK